MATNLAELQTLSVIFCSSTSNVRAFQENPYRIPELKISVQSGNEVISKEVLTKVLNNVILCLNQVHDLREHHMKHVLT
jgi:uncharacterized protein YlzI (FlbEa/FlbD family)